MPKYSTNNSIIKHQKCDQAGANLTPLTSLSLLFMALLYFDATSFYIQLWLFDEKIISTSTFLAALIIIAILRLSIANKILNQPPQIALILLSSVSILILFTHYATNLGNTPQLDTSILASSSLLGMLSLLLALQMGSPPLIHHHPIEKWLIISSAPILLYGLHQITFGYSDTTLMIFNEYITNVPHDFSGLNRPFSLFTQSSYFGLFTSFVFIITLNTASHSNKLANSIILYLLATALLIGSIASFTRVSLLSSALMILFYITYTRTKGSNALIILPFAYFLLATFLFTFAEEISNFLSLAIGSLASHETTSIRASALEYYLSTLMSSSIFNASFGLGPEVIQSALDTQNYIDNSFLSITLSTGVIGLSLWLIASTATWVSMFSSIKRSPSPLGIAILSFWSTWLAVGVFSNDTKSYLLLGILFYMTCGHYHTRAQAQQ